MRSGSIKRAAIRPAVLRFYEDLDIGETASTMRCSEGTVKALTSRGIARLRPLIGDVSDDE